MTTPTEKKITAVQPADASRTPRLRFTEDETAYTDHDSTSTARPPMPKAREFRADPTFSEQRGKRKHRLVFDEQVRSQQAQVQGSAATRPVFAAANAAVSLAHGKLREVENDNVAVKAAHEGMILSEQTARSAYRQHKLAPYRREKRLAEQQSCLNERTAFHETRDTSAKSGSNRSSRAAQKQRQKRKYAKSAREARRTGGSAGRAANAAGKAAEKAAQAVKAHPIAALVIAIFAFLLLYIMTSLSSCGSFAGGGAGSLFATSYLAADADIDLAELAYTEWETDLQLEIARTENTHPGYDEYRYSVPDIGHGPFELMAFLTVEHKDFSYAMIESELRTLFSQQYKLEYAESTETRTRTATKIDPNSAVITEQEEEFEYRILSVTLTALSFTDVILPRLDAQETQLYSLLTRTKGNRQIVGSPFEFNWLTYVSDGYGWRIHPISGAKDLHRGADIEVAAGTEITAAHDGIVTFAGDSGDYGLIAVLEDAAADGGSIFTKYAHCSEILAAVGQSVRRGDVIARVGSTGSATGPHLHFELLKNGEYLNPLYFALTNDDGSGYIPPGQPGGIPIPIYPGAPMDDEQFAAMMAEAQKHLGKPYVYGTSGPNTFDCSGFVCYVLNHSIRPGFGRINAQSIYNRCTPVTRANAQPGDLIFFTGTYVNRRTVTHIGIYIGNGQMIHAGSPVQYTDIDSRYWTQHFYAFARLPEVQ
ncbi:MAG: peptidoglycan DD-metalloendopeptidase family protein [Oscillospiraceae bacterium]|jgi:murein DD-endopeptidase MepM/ murein hydrolase activator NlpD|nr:peptidoglycan DD-metalloendopeptidase family protein [Oscillospiraceae bacterium]